MSTSKRIVLGSGKLYLTQYNGEAPDSPDVYCVDENLLGHIKGGATIEYTPTFYEAKDDLGEVVKTIITDESAVLKTGILTFDAQTLSKLCDAYTLVPSGDGYELSIGGINNAHNHKYIIVFHHTDPIDGDIYVMIVGQNQAGFSLAFAKDSETVIDAEFKCLPMDTSGVLIRYFDSGVKSATGE